MTDLDQVRADLLAEQASLDDVVAGITDEAWDTPTPSPGWTVADQIAHLAYFDGTATLAIEDPDAFNASVGELLTAAGEGSEALDALTLARDVPPADLLDRWRDNRARLAEAASGLDDGARIPWYGPPMGAKSFLTARLMETWAHGQDVVDALGAQRPATDRLRHIAQLGYITRGWSYRNRGLEVPEGDVRLELIAPSGATWTWGPEGAADVVRGPALDLCLVVTQRRHPHDTELEITGEIARDWLERAQAFAGPPTDGPAPRRP
jgi:uncharacterized protein (TIGR03084 family)